MKNKFSKMIVLVIIVLLLIAIVLFSVFQSKKSQLNLTIDTSSEESMAVNFLRFGRFLQHGDDFFFSVYNPSLKKSGIYFYDKSENNYSKINDDNAFYLSVYDGFLYYVDVSQWMLTKISLDGQKKEEIEYFARREPPSRTN